MPNGSASSDSELTPEVRRIQVAAILALGVARHRRTTRSAKFGQFPTFRDTGLEVVSETRLSVSEGLAALPRALKCESNDGPNA
jgi:hypothetical protein